ncbi:hypothetical protein ACS0TY_024338 [Phlomoides rotata]
MDRSNHHSVAQVEESDAMKTMIMTLMEKFDAFSSSSPRETLPPLVQEQQGVQEVNYMGGTSSYNPNFKSHENFSYANQRAAVQFPPGFNPGDKPPNNEGRPSQDDVMEAMFKKMEEFMKGTSNQIKTLEHQMGQLASTMGEQHQKGKFPSTTETNTREHCKAIKLRSGTRYDGPSNPLDEEEIVQKEQEEGNEDSIEEEELELAKEDEEDKSMGTEREKKKEQEKDESAQSEPKWKQVRGLKEKMSDEIECDAWGILKVLDHVPFPQRFVKKKLDENFANVFLLVERDDVFAYLEEKDEGEAYGWCAKDACRR